METQSHPTADLPAGSPAKDGEDPLAEIDHLMQQRLVDEQGSAVRSAQRAADRSKLSEEFAKAFEDQVRPAMEAVIERLRRNGGGGVIEEHAEDLSRHEARRLTLWMSLDGEIVGSPRPDRHPHLQLDANMEAQTMTVSEGDMWLGQGETNTAERGQWQLSEITASLVTEQVLGILRRSIRSEPHP